MVSDGAGKCGCSLPRHVYRSQKSVPVARDGFDVTWALRGIAQGGAQLGHGFVEAAIKIDEGMGMPKFLAEFLAGYDFPRMFQQKRENLEGLLLQLDANTAFAQLCRAQIYFKDAKAPTLRAAFRALHTGTPLWWQKPSMSFRCIQYRARRLLASRGEMAREAIEGCWAQGDFSFS